ncbi:GNAT family N-acetyltransferase [Nonomuraea sediminis]|uniref:GNAT family N-acetyltransferase n=1 Tax=Nonomuraea sediminis TaxID=2835864 RepID=UPI001BDD0FE6|nr:GNAT family N-acetyltransferase [Nonomuraea sediminis]
MATLLRTARLSLRDFTAADADELVTLHNDPGVMRYLNGGRPTPREVVVNETLPHFIQEGHYAAEVSGRFVGWFHLLPDFELGYRLRTDAWGNGYATEGTRALIDRAFRDLGAERVWGQTMTVNLASRRVMEKCGLRYVRTFFEDWPDQIEGSDQGDVEYELLRPDWRPTP